jgi:hypothetical protein
LTVSVEKELWDYAQSYGILARDAMSYGLQGLIESEIIKTKRATPDEIDRYLEIKNRELQYIVLVRDTEKRALDEISKIREEARKNIIQNNELEPKTPDDINWGMIPDDQKTRVYIQQIFEPDERGIWIRDLVRASDDDQRDAILNDFVKEFASRFSRDRDRPFNKIDAGDIKRVLIAWAEAEGGI